MGVVAFYNKELIFSHHLMDAARSKLVSLSHSFRKPELEMSHLKLLQLMRGVFCKNKKNRFRGRVFVTANDISFQQLYIICITLEACNLSTIVIL